MSYRYDKRKKNQRRWYGIASCLFIIVLFTSLFPWLFDILERPFTKTWDNKSIFINTTQNFFQTFRGKQHILRENAAFENEINRLQVDNLRTMYLSQELEKRNGFLSSHIADILFGNIIRRDVLGSSDIFIINQGSLSGVTVGDKVFSYDHMLIGFINNVYDTTAELVLYSKPDQEIDGILFPHEVSLSAQGYGNGSLFIKSPREIDVAEGDIFYSLEEPGSILAIVRKVVFDPRDPFKQVYLSYPVNLNEIQTVGIKKTPISAITE